MARVVRVDFQAINGTGRVLFTFGDRESGKAWVRENACRHDGVILERVEIIAHREYRPRTVRTDPFFVPACPA